MARLSVLLVDDHTATLEIVARILATKFDVVGKVQNGQAALDAAEKLHPDIVISDISMPVINGLEVAKRLLTNDPRAKIVFITVHNDPDMLREALDAGCLGYVIKPKLASDLVRALNEASLGRRFISSVSFEN